MEFNFLNAQLHVKLYALPIDFTAVDLTEVVFNCLRWHQYHVSAINVAITIMQYGGRGTIIVPRCSIMQ